MEGDRRRGTRIAAAWLALYCATAVAVAAQGSPRLNAYFTKGFEDAAWQKRAFDAVAKSWVAAAPPAPGRKAVVLSTVTREGKVLEARLDTSSGSDVWDRAALDAVRKASPFPSLPESWPNSSLEVHWHFAFAK